MDGETALRLRLTTAPDLEALVGRAIFAGKAPQNQPAPYVIINRVGGFSHHVLDGVTDLKGGRFQIDAYGATYDVAKEIGRAVIRAVHAGNDGDLHAELASEIDVYEEKAPPMWRRITDFTVTERDEDGW